MLDKLFPRVRRCQPKNAIFFYPAEERLFIRIKLLGDWMRFGIAFSNTQESLVERLSLLSDIVVKAEQLGYDSFLTTDHYMLPWGNETLETWVYLSYLTGKVSNIRL